MIRWKRIVNESIDEKSFKKLLRQNGITKLPAGTKLSYDGKLEWSKRRGYAGQKTIRNMCIQLEHAGWKRGDWTTGGTPDGSSVANSNNYTSPDGKILMSYTEYYGSTSYDNSFYITFKLVESGVNESTIKGTGRVDFDDDVVAVYDPKGKLEYKESLTIAHTRTSLCSMTERTWCTGSRARMETTEQWSRFHKELEWLTSLTT